jgi:hypothetical protein
LEKRPGTQKHTVQELDGSRFEEGILQQKRQALR